MDNEKVYAMKFAKVYPLLVAKAERKGRSKEEVDEVICWLTGYDDAELQEQIQKEADYRTFFAEAPAMNPNRRLITGAVCGIRVENIEEPLMQEIRYLDKLVDELAKGKKMEKIFREPDDRISKTTAVSRIAGKSSDKPPTIDAYIAESPEAVQEILQKVRTTLKDALPNATEKISWSMPTYWDGHNIIHFAAMKKHVGLYPGAEAVEYFSERLDELGIKHSNRHAELIRSSFRIILIMIFKCFCVYTANLTCRKLRQNMMHLDSKSNADQYRKGWDI